MQMPRCRAQCGRLWRSGTGRRRRRRSGCDGGEGEGGCGGRRALYRSVMALETSHASDPTLDAAMVLFKAIVQVRTRPVPDRPAQRGADRPRMRALAVRRHPIGRKPMVALAERKKASAACMSRRSLSIASISLPSRPIVR